MYGPDSGIQLRSTCCIIRWNTCGPTLTPMGKTVHIYVPKGVMNAVSGGDSSASLIWWKPSSRSVKVKKKRPRCLAIWSSVTGSGICSPLTGC